MIDVCFSDSEKGILNEFLNHKEQKSISKEYLGDASDLYDALSAPSEKIFSIRYYLDRFHISDDVFESERIELLNHFYPRACNAKRRYNIIKNDVDYIIREAENGNTIRIWYSHVGYSLCGMYYIVSRLKNINANIILIPYPDRSLDAWSFADPREIKYMLTSAHSASAEELETYSAKWEKLCSENSELRVVENDEVISVNDDYFDELIYSCADEKPIHYVHLLGVSLGRIGDAGNFALDGFVCDRINEMIDRGLFKVIGQHEPEFEYEDLYPLLIIEKTKN